MRHTLRLSFKKIYRDVVSELNGETLKYGIRFPALLQRSSNFTKLIILHHHDKVCHCGVEA